jgi:hypothetical protein
MNTMNGLRSIFSILVLAAVTTLTGRAQGTGEDPIGFKGGYKALSRLCETNLDGAARLLENDYSRGYFVSLEIHSDADTVTNISFLTATSPQMAREITLALKGTNGKWMKRDKARKLLIPIFFCQNTPPSDSLFSQLLVANNVGFNVPGSPDQWPEAAEGIWIHPICPMVSGRAPRAPMPYAPPSGTATTSVQQFAPTSANPSTAVPDSISGTGIYLTEADFDAGIMTYASTFPIEEKDLISWSAVNYISYRTTIRVRTSAIVKEYKEFPSSSIFGFKSNNVKYIYVKTGKSFLPVVYKGSPFCLFMTPEKQVSDVRDNGDLTGRMMYAKTLDGPLKEFTRKRIDEEFGSNPKMAADLQTLRKGLNDHTLTITPGGFNFCKQLAKDCLSKYAN